MAESWQVKTYVDIKSALSMKKKVTVTFHDASAKFGGVTSHTITSVRTCANKTELEITFDTRDTFIPINEFDLIAIEK
jgi:hypothetical protein